MKRDRSMTELYRYLVSPSLGNVSMETKRGLLRVGAGTVETEGMTGDFNDDFQRILASFDAPLIHPATWQAGHLTLVWLEGLRGAH